MNIIFGSTLIEEISAKYTVLELDSIPHPEQGLVPAYCVVPVEKIVFEMSILETNVALHSQLIEAMHHGKTELTTELCHLLKGKFGGELDTFYDEIISRVERTNSTMLQSTS
jgi:hypothetical protein